MAEEMQAQDALTPGAKRLVETARAKAGTQACGVNHWLLALVERHGPMAETLTSGLNAGLLAGGLREKLAGGQTGDALAEDAVTAQAVARAQGRGKAQAGSAIWPPSFWPRRAMTS